MLQFGGGGEDADVSIEEEVDPITSLVDANAEITVSEEEFQPLPEPIELDPAEAHFIDEDTGQNTESLSGSEEILESAALPERSADQGSGPEVLASDTTEHEAEITSKSNKTKNAATSLEDSSALFAALGPGFSDE